MSKITKISASGRITSVAPTFAFISSKKYGSVFVNTSTELDIDGTVQTDSDDLTTLLQVDDVVHFKAIKNFGPKDCPWLATWLRRSRHQEPTFVSPPTLTDEHGVVIDVQDRNMFIWSHTYGEVYYSIGVHLSTLDEDKATASQSRSMREFFRPNEAVIFNAIRQTETNNCLYMATAVRNLAEAACSIECTDTRTDIGRIVKLMPHFGYILSDSLGMVFFSLSNCVLQSPSQQLVDVLTVNDLVKFNPMRQPEVNGCSWRALNVTRLGVPASDEAFTRHTAAVAENGLMIATMNLEEELPNPSAVLNTEDKACQTHPSPESLLLRALLSNPNFCDELRCKFPHLMRMIDKSL